MNKKLLIPMFLCFFVFFSCSTEKKDWENAESENTIASYESFLQQHPKGKFAESANTKIEEMKWLQAALDASKDTEEVKLYGSKTIIPYGRSKLLTIFNPQKFERNRVEMSYKLENGMEEKPILIASFTEGNIAVGAGISRYYYFESTSGNRYNMSEKTIKFHLWAADWVSGLTKVRIYFLMEKDSGTDIEAFKAVSNVITLRKEY